MDGVWGELEEIDGEGVECSNIGGLEETGCIFFAFLQEILLCLFRECDHEVIKWADEVFFKVMVEDFGDDGGGFSGTWYTDKFHGLEGCLDECFLFLIAMLP